MDLEWRRGTVASDGEDIYWELTSTGDGDDRPVVVLSHGAGGTHAVWFQQVPVLGREFRVVTWDSRGFGNSTNRTDQPTAAGAAVDLVAVLDHLGIDSAHLVGQSMGGWHISAFATANPDRVRSLVYANTVGALWTEELRDAMRAFQATGGLVPDGPDLIGGHRALWPGTAAADPALAFLYQALGSFHSPPMARLGETIQIEIEHEQVVGLGVPVLFVSGPHDQIFPASGIEASSTLIPGARFVEIPDAGHSPYFEQPAAWNDAVLTFLRDAAG